jgi:Phage tail assembly chaperone protein, TAC
MSDAFGPGALRLSGLAAQWLGWRPRTRAAATPAELTAALAPPNNQAGLLTRSDLTRLMEHENDR